MTHLNHMKKNNHAMYTSHGTMPNTEPIDWYINQLRTYPLLSREQEQELFRKYKAGESTAFEKLVNCNLRLVVAVAKWYARGDRIPITDLIQEGNMGLMHAITKFDPERGLKLSTYATTWIRQYILRAIPELERHIHIPCYVHEDVIRMRKYEVILTGELGREPTLDELAVSTGFTVEHLLLIQYHSLPIPESLDAPLHDFHEDTPLHDLLEDPDANFSEWDSTTEDIQSKVHHALAQLQERERSIIMSRYGINEQEKEYTLQELGEKHNVTRERVRQVEVVAMKKLEVLLAPAMHQGSTV